MQGPWYCVDCKAKAKSKGQQKMAKAEPKTAPKREKAPMKSTRADQPASSEEPKTQPKRGRPLKKAAKKMPTEGLATSEKLASPEKPKTVTESGRVPIRAAKEESKAMEVPKTLTRGELSR
jgi:hypothetical protein